MSTKTIKSIPSFLQKIKVILLEGEINIKGTRVPKLVITGVVGAVLLYVAVAGVVTIATPWWSRGDTDQHVDYIWRVYNGEIPKREDGIQYPPFIEIQGHKPQAASANPPLFYVLHAPFVGPLLEQGEWQKAVAVGRTINVGLGVLCVLALAWAGWLLGGGKKALLAVGVPAIAVLTYRFTRLNIDYGLDALLLLFVSLAMINTYKIIKHGITLKYLLALGLLSVLGMATKAPYIVALVVSMLGVVVAAYVHRTGGTVRSIIRGISASLALMLIALLSTGWFYFVWNYLEGGSWFTARPDGYTGGRAVKSVKEVLFSEPLWSLFYAQYTRDLSLSVSIISFATAGYLSLGMQQIKKFIKTSKEDVLMLSLLVLLLLGIFSTQIEHAVGVGSINFRYLIPALLPIGLYIVYGLSRFNNMRGQLIALAAISMGFSSIVAKTHGSGFATIYNSVEKNGIPGGFLTILMVVFAAGAVLLSVSLFKLSKPTSK